MEWLTCVAALQNFTVDQCGPVHITMGDGGNIEGVCERSALLLLAVTDVMYCHTYCTRTAPAVR